MPYILSITMYILKSPLKKGKALTQSKPLHVPTLGHWNGLSWTSGLMLHLQKKNPTHLQVPSPLSPERPVHRGNQSHRWRRPVHVNWQGKTSPWKNDGLGVHVFTHHYWGAKGGKTPEVSPPWQQRCFVMLIGWDLFMVGCGFLPPPTLPDGSPSWGGSSRLHCR